MSRRLLLLTLLGPALAAQAWRPVEAGTTAELRGLAVAGPEVVWITGSAGTVKVSEDGGAHWRSCVVPGGEGLDFRAVVAMDATRAWVLSAGPGDQGRIYRTTDGGRSWTLQFRNPPGEGFLDALAFQDDRHGLALGDPIRGRFQILRTEDGGATWAAVGGASLAALPEEGAFAASNTCLRMNAAGEAWFATGSARQARVFHSGDGGRSWTAAEVPVPAGEASKGLFSLALLGGGRGLAFGGDHQQPGLTTLNGALTEDGGRSWRPAPVLPGGYRSGSSAVPGLPGAVVTVGLTGTGLSLDGGRTWKILDEAPLNAVAFQGRDGWAVGPKGRVMRLDGDLAPSRASAP